MTKAIPYWHVDAFADRPFTGKLAAVMQLGEWLDDATLQAIGAENMFAETAFIVADASGEADWELRWFTPEMEIGLCGHATLASGHVLLGRDPARDRALPYVQSSVITGPYLKLVVPYRPRHDEPAMLATCGHRTAGLEGEALAIAQLACLHDLHAVTLDGKPLTGLRYEIASDPRTDRPALLAMIDVRELPRGRHELRVARPPRADRKPAKDNPDPSFDAIPFWR